MDGAPVAIGGGLESISLAQMTMNRSHFANEWLLEHKPAIYMPMIATAPDDDSSSPACSNIFSFLLIA